MDGNVPTRIEGIKYHGVVQTFVYLGSQEFPGKPPLPLYHGSATPDTLSIGVLIKLQAEQKENPDSLPDLVVKAMSKKI